MAKARPRTNPRGLLTPAALHILMALADGALHGYGIKQVVEDRTVGSLRLGPATLYEAIHRMLRAGWIADTPKQPSGSDARAGRRKYYRLTPEGRKQMQQELARLDGIVRLAKSKDLLPGTPR